MRQLWAAAFAPLTLLRTKLSMAPALLLGGAVGVTVGGIAVLMWGIVRTRDAPRLSPTDALIRKTATSTTRPTGNAEVDRILGAIEHHDVDVMTELAAFIAIGCPDGGLAPGCAPSDTASASASAFWVGGCGKPADYVTSLQEARSALADAFPSGQRSSIYAVANGALTKNADGFWIVVTPGGSAAAGAPAISVFSTPDGRRTRSTSPVVPPAKI